MNYSLILTRQPIKFNLKINMNNTKKIHVKIFTPVTKLVNTFNRIVSCLQNTDQCESNVSFFEADYKQMNYELSIQY